MPRTRHLAEEIVAKLRQADVLLAQGQTGGDVARVLGVTETTYYRWCPGSPAIRLSLYHGGRH
jgi:putative transposase